MGRVRIQTRTNPGAVSAIRDFILGLDYAQLTALLFLLGIGLVFIHSTGLQVDTPLSRSFLAKQLQWIAAGTVLWLAAAVIDYRKVQYRVLAVLFYLATVALLVAVLLFGVTVYGATRWLSIFGQRLQPSEFSKLSLTLILAAMFSTPFFNINRFRWLAAATALAKEKESDAPHLIYMPETKFNKAEFLADAKACIEKYGFCSIVCGEGIKYADGTPVSSSQTKDKFNNIEFGAMGGSSVALQLHRMLREETGYRGEFQITESLIMCAADRAVQRDIDEAFACGEEAVRLATAGESGVMVTMIPDENDPKTMKFGQAPLSEVAVNAKEMPRDFINERGNFVTEKFFDYMRPLVSDLPHYVELDKEI